MQFPISPASIQSLSSLTPTSLPVTAEELSEAYLAPAKTSIDFRSGRIFYLMRRCIPFGKPLNAYLTDLVQKDLLERFPDSSTVINEIFEVPQARRFIYGTTTKTIPASEALPKNFKGHGIETSRKSNRLRFPEFTPEDVLRRGGYLPIGTWRLVKYTDKFPEEAVYIDEAGYFYTEEFEWYFNGGFLCALPYDKTKLMGEPLRPYRNYLDKNKTLPISPDNPIWDSCPTLLRYKKLQYPELFIESPITPITPEETTQDAPEDQTQNHPDIPTNVPEPTSPQPTEIPTIRGSESLPLELLGDLNPARVI